MTYGPRPWQQSHWDWRAAGNFMGGGAGSGLIIFTAISGVQGLPAAVLLLAGLTLIGLGLACVWAELGRPLRALHVFFNPRTSWMTREAITATVLMPVGAVAAAGTYAGIAGLAWPVAALALAFVYCQSRMLQAARGIAAWREPLTVALMLGTSVAEGAGLFWLANLWHARGDLATALLFALLLIVRAAIWLSYRRRVAGRVASRALAALDRTGRTVLVSGTAAPLLLLFVAAIDGAAAAVLASLAGLLAALSGTYMKFALVTRAGFNQGFALKELPVRGARVGSP